MAELSLKENLDLATNFESKHHIQNVQCLNRWTNSCLNKQCWAFQVVKGNYFCEKK